MNIALVLFAFVILILLAKLGHMLWYADNSATIGEETNQEDETTEGEKTTNEMVLTLDDLKDVKGIGPAREKKLIDEFGSKRKVLMASDDEISEIIPSHIVERLRNKTS